MRWIHRIDPHNPPYLTRGLKQSMADLAQISLFFCVFIFSPHNTKNIWALVISVYVTLMDSIVFLFSYIVDYIYISWIILLSC